jgi:hypothetical protein
MAQVDFAVDHGQEPDAVRANFEQSIAKVQTRFATWVHQVIWSDDRTSVTLIGTGFNVVLSYDEQKVYVHGTVPIAFKMMEGPVKSLIAQALADES